MIRDYCTVILVLFAFTPGVSAQEAAEEVAEEELVQYEAAMEAAVLEEVAAEEGEEEFILPPDPETAKVQAYLAVRRGLIDRVCELSPEQKTKLTGMDNKWLAKLSKKNEVLQNGPVARPGLIGMFFGVQQQAPRVIRKQNLKTKVDEELDLVLTDDQKKQIQIEQKASKDFRNSATADALIECLQDRLDMTQQQRAKIKKKILPWVDRSDLVVVHYFNGNDYYPDIPVHLMDALTNEQRQAYLGLQRHVWTDANFNDGNPPIVIEE